MAQNQPPFGSHHIHSGRHHRWSPPSGSATRMAGNTILDFVRHPGAAGGSSPWTMPPVSAWSVSTGNGRRGFSVGDPRRQTRSGARRPQVWCGGASWPKETGVAAKALELPWANSFRPPGHIHGSDSTCTWARESSRFGPPRAGNADEELEIQWLPLRDAADKVLRRGEWNDGKNGRWPCGRRPIPPANCDGPPNSDSSGLT